MKLLNKVKKGVTGIGLFLITLHNKVLAQSASDYENIDPSRILEYLQQPDYGVRNPNQNSSIELGNVYKFLAVILVLLIGLIVYFKKSKSSIKKKVLIAILAIAIAILVYFLIKS